MTKKVVPHPKPVPRYRRNFVREWRKYRGLTQEQLADRVGWSVGNVSKLEQGQQGYSDKGLAALADALRCEPPDLLNVDPTKHGATTIWSIWESASQGDRIKILEIAKTITGKTGTDG